MEKVFYTPEELAERLKVSRENVYRLIRAGKLRAIKIGRIYRISEEDLEEFIREAKEKATEGRDGKGSSKQD